MSVDDMRLNLSHCHYPARGLGYGKRVGIWLQGCSIRCPGCIVPETWEAETHHVVFLRDLLASLLPWLSRCDGVTISGGEPFDQPEGLLALTSALRVLCAGDILVYTGYSWNTISTRYSAVLQHIDVVASEPFVAKRHENLPLIGSSNQRVHLLTSLAEEKYADWPAFQHEIGVCEQDGTIRMAGILRRGELKQIAQDLSQEGWEATLTHDTI